MEEQEWENFEIIFERIVTIKIRIEKLDRLKFSKNIQRIVDLISKKIITLDLNRRICHNNGHTMSRKLFKKSYKKQYIFHKDKDEHTFTYCNTTND